MNTPKVRTVCVVGASADVAARITSLLDEQRSHLLARWRSADQAHADLLIIDADSVYGHMDWLKACSSGRLVVACTASPDAYDAQFRLRNPVVAAALVEVLNRISVALGDKPESVPAAAPAAQAPAASRPVMSKPAAAKPVRAPADHHPVAAEAPPADVPAPVAHDLYLVDLLEVEAPLKGRLRLAAEGLPTLLLDPHERIWHCASALKSAADWCTRSLSPADVKSLDAKEFAADAASMNAHPYMRLQWLAHLVRGDGHMEAGLDVNARYKLSRWPQSEREFPRHFRIATMMLKQAATLDEIAEQSGATIADVANFVNAYHAIGYIDVETADQPQESANRGGLFGRMRKTSAN